MGTIETIVLVLSLALGALGAIGKRYWLAGVGVLLVAGLLFYKGYVLIALITGAFGIRLAIVPVPEPIDDSDEFAPHQDPFRRSVRGGDADERKRNAQLAKYVKEVRAEFGLEKDQNKESAKNVDAPKFETKPFDGKLRR